MRFRIHILVILILLSASIASGGAPTGEDQGIQDRLERAVRELVSAGFDKTELEGEIASLLFPPLVDRLHPEAKVKPIKVFLPPQAAGRYVLPFRITAPSGRSDMVQVTVSTVAVIHGWTPLRPLARGDAIRRDLFKRKTLRVARRERDYVAAQDIPAGTRLTTSIRPGDLLMHHHFEPVPDVQQGEQVTLVVKKKSLTLTLRGRVRSDGRIGDRIPVIVQGTGKRIYGRLAEGSLVVVE